VTPDRKFAPRVPAFNAAPKIFNSALLPRAPTVSPMQPLLQILVTLGALALLPICAFGFLATFEPNPPAQQWTFRALYAVLPILGLLALRRVWRR
jgi:hypothetical protein